MARYSTTYSGDTASFIGGKISSAVSMARAESDAQEKDKQAGLSVANSGNLFVKALGTEFGGDLFSRTIGVLNPNQSAKQTDRASTKAKRFAANFPRTEKQEEEEKKSNEDVDRAVDDLLKDDDHTPVKDEQLREYVTRVFGVGIDSKLTQLDQRISKSLSTLSNIKTTQQGSVDLQVDHNELVAGKLDKILTLYNEQFAYQNILKDRAQVAGKENELERVRDLSSTRRFMATNLGDTGGAILGGLSDKLVKGASRVILEKLGFKKLTQGVAKKSLTESVIRRSLTKIGFRSSRVSKLVKTITQTPAFRNILLKKGPVAAADFVAKTASSPVGLNIIEKGRGRSYMKKVMGVDNPNNLKSVSKIIQDLGKSKVFGGSQEAVTKATQAADSDMLDDVVKNLINNPDSIKKPTLETVAEGGRRKITKKTAKQLSLDIGKKKVGQQLSLDMAGAGVKAANKTTQKAAQKAAKKSGGKLFKFIPGLGTAIALGEAAYRASQGDMTGAGLSLLSAIPILGWGVTAVDIGRDVGFNPLGLPPPPGEGGFEQGNRYGLTNRGVSMLHGTEYIQSMDPTSGMASSHIQHIGDTLVSTSMKMAQDLGVSREISSKVSTLPFAVRSISYNTGAKTAPPKSTSSNTFTQQSAGNLSDWVKSKVAESDMVEKAEKDATEDEGGRGGFNPADMFFDTIRFGRHMITGGKKAIRIHDKNGQGPDSSGEPGIDFSYDDFKSNYSLFNGEVVETGLLYGEGYGNVVVVRSIDPSNGQPFDALYAHFPDGGIAVKKGQKIRGGQYLGKVGFTSVATPGVPEIQPNNAGNMSGWHTSVDFFEPNSTTAYSNGGNLIGLIMAARGASPSGNNILSKLNPSASAHDANFRKEYLKEMEGFRPDVYLDTNLKPTVGYGHLIDAGSPADIRNLQVGDTISKERAIELFEMDFQHHLAAAQKLPGWNRATDNQKTALLDVVYNMGPNFLNNFPMMRKALEKGDFMEAARQLEFADPDNRPGVKSDWFNDVKERRNQPTLDLLRDKSIDGNIHPHLKHILPKKLSSNVAPNVKSTIALNQVDNFLDDSKMYNDLEETSGTMKVVVLNNNIINKTVVKNSNNTFRMASNNLDLIKTAKLVG